MDLSRYDVEAIVKKITEDHNAEITSKSYKLWSFKDVEYARQLTDDPVLRKKLAKRLNIKE